MGNMGMKNSVRCKIFWLWWLWDDGKWRGLERADEGLEVDFGQRANVTPSAKFVAYDFSELRAESDDGRTIGRGLGELNR